jgi:predicted amidophosphoribosyltransferase
MQCERCHDVIPEGEEREHYGRVLCEDCYMDLLSPLKACDPWAVHSAKSFSKDERYVLHLNENQKKILDILKEKGSMEIKTLLEALRIKETDLERELASLRHMGKVRGELRNGKRRIRLWE